MAYRKRIMDYRVALGEMRKVTPSDDPIPFSVAWFEAGSPPNYLNAGKFREEHNVVLCGQLDSMKGKWIDIRYKDGDYHDTRILLQNLYMFNDTLIHL